MRRIVKCDLVRGARVDRVNLDHLPVGSAYQVQGGVVCGVDALDGDVRSRRLPRHEHHVAIVEAIGGGGSKGGADDEDEY